MTSGGWALDRDSGMNASFFRPSQGIMTSHVYCEAIGVKQRYESNYISRACVCPGRNLPFAEIRSTCCDGRHIADRHYLGGIHTAGNADPVADPRNTTSRSACQMYSFPS